MNDCIFCKIARKEIFAEIVSEDAESLSFLDINPVNEGHLLIVPKKHYSSFAETPEDLVSSLFIKAKELMPIIQKSMGADFVALTIVGKDVPHFHIHLIPRYENDGLAGFWPTKKYRSIEDMKRVGDKIRQEL